MHERAEREHVAPCVHGVASRLLRRHVRRRARDRAHGRNLPVSQRVRETEIDQLHACDVAADEQDVARLDVPMNEAALVGVTDGHGDLLEDRDGLGGPEVPSLEPRAEVLALEPLHREVRLLGLDPVGYVSNDVRVVERRERPRLRSEVRDDFGRCGPRHLDGHRLARRAVDGAIDLPHSTRACERHDLEAGGLKRANLPILPRAAK